MKRIVFQIFNIFFLLSVPAQAQDLKWSQPQKITERGFSAEIIGQNSEGIFVVRKNYRQPERNVILEHYTQDMRLLHSKNFASGKGEYFAQAVLLANNLQLFYLATNTETKALELRVKTLEVNLTSKKEDSVLARMPGPDFAERKLQVYKPVSRQQSLFIYTRQNSVNPTNYKYLLVDTTLNTLAAGELNLEIPDNYEVENAAFTSSHIALLIREDVKRKVNKQGYNYYIAEVKVGDATARITPLFNDSITVTEGILKADYLQNNIVFAGLFNMKDSVYTKGYFMRSNNLNSGQIKITSTPFPKNIIEEMAGKNAKVQGIRNLRSGDMILRKDGGVVLTSEEYEETREAVMDMNMYGVSQTNFRYYYYYENMLVLSINPDGGLDWHTVLCKEQVSVNDNGIYSSYTVSAMADKLVYVYNDLSRKSWNLSLFEVNADGVADNRIILRAQDYEAKLVPQYARQIAYNEVLIPGLSHKGYVLLKVKL